MLSLPAVRSAAALAPFLALVVACSRTDAQAPPPPGPPVVEVAQPLVQQIVEWDRYTGRLEPVEEVEIRARVSGYLQSLHFAEGQHVKRGDLLAVVDPRPFEAEVARSQALLTEARARREQSVARLAQAEAERAQANSARGLAASRLENAREAQQNNAIAREEFAIREERLAQTEAALEAANAQIAAATADIASSEAAIEVARAALRQARLDLDYTRVTAPIDGRIGERLVTRGNLIEGGSVLSTLITTIVALDPIHVTFNADEQAYLKYVRLAQKGQRLSSRDSKNPIYVALLDEEGYPHRGHMDFVDNRIDEDTSTILARGILRNTDLTLAPGLFATVRLPGSARYEAVMVPDAAISANQDTRFVLVLDEQDAAQVRPVKLGPLIDGYRVIREGLTGEERIVVAGLQRVRPGTVVSPTPIELELAELEDGLPNDYQPLPEDEWITREPDPDPPAPREPEGDDR